MGSTLLSDGYFQVSAVTALASLGQSPHAPGCGQDHELPISVCPRRGKRAFPISRLSQLPSRLFQLRGLAELRAPLLLVAQRVR